MQLWVTNTNCLFGFEVVVGLLAPVSAFKGVCVPSL
jgi:hypothetical protein